MSRKIIPEPSLEPPEYTVPRCPICGEEADTLYRDKYGDIVGRDGCLQTVDAWEWEEEYGDDY